MNVLIDTNVALDYFLKREGFAENAKRVFHEVISGDINGCLSSSVVTDIYYCISRQKNADIARKVVEEVYRYLIILTVSEVTIGEALALPMHDFEDAVQVAAAQDFDIDIVVTRDKDGFSDSGLKVYTPEEFLETLKRRNTDIIRLKESQSEDCEKT
jgi:predicted nucleic acid-binding protein